MPNITGNTGIQVTLAAAVVIGVSGISFQGGRLTNRVDANAAQISANKLHIEEVREITGKLTTITAELAVNSKHQPVNHNQTIRLNASELGDMVREILKARGELPK